MVLPCGTPVLESAAMVLWIGEQFGGHNHALFGKPEQRAKLYQWIFYGPATLYASFVVGFKDDVEAKEKAKEHIQKKLLPYIDAELGDKHYLLGDEYTLADAVMSYDLYGVQHLKWLEGFPRLDAYLARCSARPSWGLTFPPYDPSAASAHQ